jgi:hypothetical protein
MGPAKTVRTRPGNDLTLDPFHRSNPFRHAFHQRHARGAQITRRLEIRFDDEQPVAGQLRGTYHETISGLTKSGLQLTGTVAFHHASPVATLD